MDPNIFREYDIRGLVDAQLTDETVAELARAIGTFYASNGAERIAIGYDARESSPRFAELLAAGLNASGCDAVMIGMVTTPVLYHTVFTADVDGGVMITGSHNPPEYNGFKICLGRDALFGSQIQEIRSIAESGEFSAGAGTITRIEVIDDYLDDLAGRVKLGPESPKVVIDAGNGMGGVTAVPLFQRIGISPIELFTEPDSTFPNHHPDPTVTENLEDLIRAVAEHKADLGIAFDGDGDRIGVVDETGRVIWGDELMVLYSRAVLRERPGAAIIAEVKCSQTLFDEIEKSGGRAIMWKAGHSLIKAKMKEENAALAGEMSGHIFFADRFYGFDDAAYAALRLIEIMSQDPRLLSEMLANIPKTVSTPELRVPCPDDLKFEVVKSIADSYARTHKVITIDGARILFEHGWGLVRASNTQEILVLRFEADTSAHLDEIRAEVQTRVTAAIQAAQAAGA